MHLSKLKMLRSNEWNLPVSISSAAALPAAGDCCSPCPEKPFSIYILKYVYAQRDDKILEAKVRKKKTKQVYPLSAIVAFIQTYQNIRHLRVKVDDSILIDNVVFIQSGPRRSDFDVAKGWNSMKESRPNDIFKEVDIGVVQGVEIVYIRIMVVTRRASAEKRCIFT